MSTKTYSLDGLAAHDVPLPATPNFPGTECPMEEARLTALATEEMLEHSASANEAESPTASLKPLSSDFLSAEADFYGQYAYCVNAFPTTQEAVKHLLEELNR